MDESDERALPDLIYVDIYRHLADRLGANAGESPGFEWTDSPYPVWGKACFGLDLRAPYGAKLEALREKARELGCLVATGPACRPARRLGDVEARLEAAGFARRREAAGMVLRRESFEPRPAPEGLSIVLVSRNDDWMSWASVVCRNLFGKESEKDAAGFAAIGKALSGGGRFRAYAGRDRGGRILATSAAYRGELGSDGVFFVAVEAAARRRGYGGALTSHAGSVCIRAGAEYTSLMATPAGRPVYEALGFRAVSTMGRYGLRD